MGGSRPAGTSVGGCQEPWATLWRAPGPDGRALGAAGPEAGAGSGQAGEAARCLLCSGAWWGLPSPPPGRGAGVGLRVQSRAWGSVQGPREEGELRGSRAGGAGDGVRGGAAAGRPGLRAAGARPTCRRPRDPLWKTPRFGGCSLHGLTDCCLGSGPDVPANPGRTFGTVASLGGGNNGRHSQRPPPPAGPRFVCRSHRVL